MPANGNGYDDGNQGSTPAPTPMPKPGAGSVLFNLPTVTPFAGTPYNQAITPGAPASLQAQILAAMQGIAPQPINYGWNNPQKTAQTGFDWASSLAGNYNPKSYFNGGQPTKWGSQTAFTPYIPGGGGSTGTSPGNNTPLGPGNPNTGQQNPGLPPGWVQNNGNPAYNPSLPFGPNNPNPNPTPMPANPAFGYGISQPTLGPNDHVSTPEEQAAQNAEYNRQLYLAMNNPSALGPINGDTLIHIIGGMNQRGATAAQINAVRSQAGLSPMTPSAQTLSNWDQTRNISRPDGYGTPATSGITGWTMDKNGNWIPNN